MLCAVNLQHNCAQHGCTDEAEAPVYEEREHVAARSAILHRQPTDLLLNTFQMRDARFVQLFRAAPGPIDREHAIMEGVRSEIDLQKAQRHIKIIPSHPVVPTHISSPLR